jgi:translation initiation factor 3 subunit D
MNIKALNSWRVDPAMDWRQKLDSQRGAVLATELKNNAYVFPDTLPIRRS